MRKHAEHLPMEEPPPPQPPAEVPVEDEPPVKEPPSNIPPVTDPKKGTCMKRMTRVAAAIVFGSYGAWASATLPPVTPEAKAKAAETAAKAAWTDKVGAYKTCLAMDRTAEAYRRDIKAAGKDAPAPTQTPACTDPGAFVYNATPITPAASKPLEAAGAHSPPGQAVSPPSTNTPAGEIAGAKK